MTSAFDRVYFRSMCSCLRVIDAAITKLESTGINCDIIMSPYFCFNKRMSVQSAVSAKWIYLGVPEYDEDFFS